MSDLELVNHLPQGIVLNQRYRLEKALGAGGFGITYLATDTALERTVAVKELYPQALYRVDRDGTTVTVPRSKKDGHGNLVRRIIKQGHLFRSFEHPNLVDIYEAFLDNNTAYLVMAFLDGRDVSSLLQEHGQLPEAEVKQLLHDVSNGLRYMHQRGAFHLDIKPSNIFYTDGRYVLIDYGESKTVGNEMNVDMSTGGHTEGFMALEQANANTEKGPFTDLYAFGVTLYECLMGRRPPPFYARMAEAKMESLALEDAWLQRRVEWAMEVYPEDRPRTVDFWLAPEAAEPEPEPDPPTILMDEERRRTLQEQQRTLEKERQRQEAERQWKEEAEWQRQEAERRRKLEQEQQRQKEQQQQQQQEEHQRQQQMEELGKQLFDPFFSDASGQPDPVQPDPVQPDPVEPDPVKPEPVEPDPVKPEPVLAKKADLGRRFGAFFFDSLIAAGFGILFLAALMEEIYSESEMYMAYGLGHSLYLVFRDGLKGGSWGKKLMKLRLEHLDGQKVGAGTSFKRNWMWLFFIIPQVGVVIVLGVIVVEILKASSGPEGRRLGDHWAGTRVVAQTRPARRA